MELSASDKLKFCQVCEKRKMDFNVGIVCSLTGEKPAFVSKCDDFAMDMAEANRKAVLKQKAEAGEVSGGGFAAEQAGIQKGVLGGVAMMVIAAIWFFAGLAADRIFFYPPILFCVGAYGLIKGLSTGNYAGNR